MGSLPDTFWGKRHLTLTATDQLTLTSKKYLCVLVEQVPEFWGSFDAFFFIGNCIIWRFQIPPNFIAHRTCIYIAVCGNWGSGADAFREFRYDQPLFT